MRASCVDLGRRADRGGRGCGARPGRARGLAAGRARSRRRRARAGRPAALLGAARERPRAHGERRERAGPGSQRPAVAGAHAPGGERLTVELTVRRPGWAGWLVGPQRARARFTVETPTRAPARPLAAGEGGRAGHRRLRHARQPRLVRRRRSSARSPADGRPVGVVASGSQARRRRRRRGRGAFVGAAAGAGAGDAGSRRSRTRSCWPRRSPGRRARAGPAARRSPSRARSRTCSAPGGPCSRRRRRAAGGCSTPTRSPSEPSGLGFPLGATVRRRAAARRAPRGQPGTTLTRTLAVAGAERLDARGCSSCSPQLGYLPVDWQPSADPAPRRSHAQLVAAVAPPPGHVHLALPEHAAGAARALAAGPSGTRSRAAP